MTLLKIGEPIIKELKTNKKMGSFDAYWVSMDYISINTPKS
jgi:hypothetical protein